MTRRLIIFAIAWLGALSVVRAHGDLDEAIEAVTTALVSSPDDAGLFLRRAELHRMHRDWPAAEADYARVGQLQPGLEATTFGLAQMRLAQGREKAGLQLLDEFIARCPAHPGGLALRAAVLEKRGEWERADADLAAAVAASPEPQYATERAALLERHGQADAAVRCLDEASRARGGVALLDQQALGIEERAGKTDAALRRLDGFIAREPRPDIWLARKARQLELSGRTQEAQAAWQQAATAFQTIPPDRRGSKVNRNLAAEIETKLSRTRVKPE